jgi:non-homologous end joining protein Ku
MAPRAYWKGYLKLSLVSCPIMLRYPYEVRDDKDYFDEIPDEKVPKDMLDLAHHIVEGKSGHFTPPARVGSRSSWSGLRVKLPRARVAQSLS